MEDGIRYLVKVEKFKDDIEKVNLNEFHALIVSKEYDLIKDNEYDNAEVGLDLYATDNMIILPNYVSLVPTGVKTACIPGFYFKIVPRSSLPLDKSSLVGEVPLSSSIERSLFKINLILANSEGIIDPTYRGEIKLILANVSDREKRVEKGKRYCQMILSSYIPLNSLRIGIHSPFEIKIGYFQSELIFDKWEELLPTYRGKNGIGSTGR